MVVHEAVSLQCIQTTACPIAAMAHPQDSCWRYAADFKRRHFLVFIQCELLPSEHLCMQATFSSRNAEKKKKKAPFNEKVSFP